MSLKSTPILFDTGVIIEAFRLNAWEALISNYNIVISQTVVDEVLYFDDNSGKRHKIELTRYINSNRIQYWHGIGRLMCMFRDSLSSHASDYFSCVFIYEYPQISTENYLPFSLFTTKIDILIIFTG